jgi:actin-related protein
MIVDAIAASDADIRKDLYSNIILTGGNSLLPGTMFSLSLSSSLVRATCTHHVTPLRTRTSHHFIALITSLPYARTHD